MPRPNITTPPKTQPTTDTNFVYRLDIAFNSPGVLIPGGVGLSGSPAGALGTYNYKIGRFAIGAEILFVKVRPIIGFAGPTAAGVTVGTNATAYNNIIASSSVLAGAAASITPAAAGLVLDTTVENDVYAQVITTVAVATAGLLRVILGVSAPVQ